MHATEDAEERRAVADDLHQWALRTRAANPAYWRYRLFLPLARR